MVVKIGGVTYMPGTYGKKRPGLPNNKIKHAGLN